MFQINDIIVYGNHGICKVMDRGRLSISTADKEKEYYTLCPLYQSESVIYVSVDNSKITMRHVISKREAESIIHEIPKLEANWSFDEKEREQKYRSVLKSCDCRELVKMLKVLYKRQRLRMQSGKKATAVDERYFRMAEEQLYQELAYVLEMEKGEVGPFIQECVQGKEK